MSTRSIFLIILLTVFTTVVKAQKWTSATSIQGDETVYNNAIARDDNGDILVAGFFTGQATFGNTTLTSGGLQDGFIAKYSNGNLVWVRQIKSTGRDEVTAIKVLPGGDFIIAGFFESTVDFAGNMLSAVNHNAFVSKFDNNGVMSWVRNVSAPFGAAQASAVTADQAGNVYVTGNFTLHVDFGITNLFSKGNIDMFVAKYDPVGTLQWVKQGGGSDQSASFYNGDKGLGIAVDPAGTSLFVTGVFNDTATFGAFTLITDVAYRGEDIFLVKYDAANGNALWARQGGGIGSAAARAGLYSVDMGKSLVVDGAGNCYMAGVFDTVAVFDQVTLTSMGYADMFLAKYNSAGTLQWAKQAGGKLNDFLGAIELDNSGNVYMVGGIMDTATFDNIQVSSAGISDVFVAKYNSAGNAQWVETAGGIDYDLATSIYVGDGVYPALYIAGTFADTARFGDVVLTGTSSSQSFISGEGFFANFQTIPTSVKETANNTNDVSIWPNPADDNLFIRLNDRQGQNEVVIYDITGRVLHKQAFNKNELTVTMKNLPAGILMAEVNGTVHKITHR